MPGLFPPSLPYPQQTQQPGLMGGNNAALLQHLMNTPQGMAILQRLRQQMAPPAQPVAPNNTGLYGVRA